MSLVIVELSVILTVSSGKIDLKVLETMGASALPRNQ